MQSATLMDGQVQYHDNQEVFGPLLLFISQQFDEDLRTYFSGTYAEDLVAPIPGFPCLTLAMGLGVIDNYVIYIL